MNSKVIDSFSGECAFLSNFHRVRKGIRVEGSEAPTAEHLFQALKTVDSDQRRWVLEASTPGDAKRRGRKVDMRPHWDEIRISVMTDIQEAKYRDAELAGKLQATGTARLIEGNNWGDRFWGVDEKGEGENWLGVILMIQRSHLIRDLT